MSITNLLEPNNYELFLHNLIIDGVLIVDTILPQFGHALNLGTAFATAINIGFTGISTNVNSDLRVTFGQTFTTSNVTGNPNLNINAANTTFNLGNTLSFPRQVGNPYSFNDSAEQISNVLAYTGAFDVPDAVRVSVRRIGDWVDVCIRQLVPDAVVTNTALPIVIVDAIPALRYEPVDNVLLPCIVNANGTYAVGHVSIPFNTQAVNIFYPSFPTANWPAGTAGITTICFSYCVAN